MSGSAKQAQRSRLKGARCKRAAGRRARSCRSDRSCGSARAAEEGPLPRIEVKRLKALEPPCAARASAPPVKKMQWARSARTVLAEALCRRLRVLGVAMARRPPVAGCGASRQHAPRGRDIARCYDSWSRHRNCRSASVAPQAPPRCMPQSPSARSPPAFARSPRPRRASRARPCCSQPSAARAHVEQCATAARLEDQHHREVELGRGGPVEPGRRPSVLSSSDTPFA